MDNNNISGMDNIPKNNKKGKIVYSVVSFILAAVPVTILLVVFLFCLFFAAIVPGGGSVIWWILIAAIVIIGPVAIITDILSIIFGVIGLVKGKKTIFAWAWTIFIILQVLAVLIFLLI